MKESFPFNLSDTYLCIDSQGGINTLAVDDSFWNDLSQGKGDPRLEDGRLLASLEMETDWNTWEMHPEGDEMIYLLSGAVDFILEENGKTKTYQIRKENPCCIIPRGVWHTAKALEKSQILFITQGKGTQHRPASL